MQPRIISGENPGSRDDSELLRNPPLDSDSRSLLDNLFSVAYEELQRLAAALKRSGPNVTLSPATLVNEAWLKLSKSSTLAFNSKLHFKCIAARAMRQILIGAARQRAAVKRGGGPEMFVTFDDSAGGLLTCDRDILALHEALEELAIVNPRQASIVEARFFGGLEISEIAEMLKVSKATVDREWRVARAWLATRIRQSRRNG
jgi:RNA polymerase sigma factor (TIGR02999 family)